MPEDLASRIACTLAFVFGMVTAGVVLRMGAYVLEVVTGITIGCEIVTVKMIPLLKFFQLHMAFATIVHTLHFLSDMVT